MLTTPQTAATLAPTDRRAAEHVLSVQLEAYVALLRDLDAADWTRQTDCTLWDVRQIAAHVAGALDEAHLRVQLRHLRAAKRAAPPAAMVDALNAAQVLDRRDLTGPAIVDDIERLAPKAIAMRRRVPTLLRRMKVPGDDLPPGSTMGYLFDIIYARDVWMHRVDTARATNRPLAATDTDAEVVAQVVRDLGRFWQGPAFVLDLAGIGAGRWLIGDGNPASTVHGDSVEFLRHLSGRPTNHDWKITGEAGLTPLIRDARVAF